QRAGVLGRNRLRGAGVLLQVLFAPLDGDDDRVERGGVACFGLALLLRRLRGGGQCGGGGDQCSEDRACKRVLPAVAGHLVSLPKTFGMFMTASWPATVVLRAT